VQTHIGHMMAGGMIAIKPPVDHVGNPRQGVPVPLLEGCKRPLDALRVHPLLHMPILQDIFVIVQRKEIVAAHSPESKDGNHRKDDARHGNLPGFMGCGSNGNVLPGRRSGCALGLGFALSRFLRHEGQSPIIPIKAWAPHPTSLLRAGFRLPTPSTKTCPFTPASKDRSLGIPSRWGPRLRSRRRPPLRITASFGCGVGAGN